MTQAPEQIFAARPVSEQIKLKNFVDQCYQRIKMLEEYTWQKKTARQNYKKGGLGQRFALKDYLFYRKLIRETIKKS